MFIQNTKRTNPQFTSGFAQARPDIKNRFVLQNILLNCINSFDTASRKKRRRRIRKARLPSLLFFAHPIRRLTAFSHPVLPGNARKMELQPNGDRSPSAGSSLWRIPAGPSASKLPIISAKNKSQADPQGSANPPEV